MGFRSRKWKAYCGFERADVVDRLESALEKVGYQYSKTEDSPSVLHSSEGVTVFEIEADEATKQNVTARVITVTGDPIFRAINSMLGRSERVGGASLIVARPVTAETKPVVQRVLREFAPDEPEHLWNLTGHIQLRRSIYIRWQTKKRWKNMLELD